MKRRVLIALCLLMMLFILTGCSDAPDQNQQIFAETTQFLGPAATNTPVPVVEEPAGETSVFDENPYDVDFTAEDAMAEEDYVDPFYAEELPEDMSYPSNQQPEGTVYPYAGSTPIPLVPVDMPSPTPKAPLTFSYTSYSSGSLGITFEAPSGWLVDDSLSDVFVLTEPETEMHDGYQCVLTFSAVPVNNNYDQDDLKKEVTQRLKSIGSLNFVEWDPSLTAKRHLMGASGIYANYSGTLANGVKVGGRILYACVDNMLYGVEVAYPLDYRDDYLEVFNHVRDTISTR